jgi:hypothetical protein
MMVFRYLKEKHALEALQTGRLKVGRLTELNDPADCQPTLEGAPEQGSEAGNEQFRRDYLAGLFRDYGVVCYSEQKTTTDAVVWSHYADGHRGIALGYNFVAARRPGRLFRVVYSERRPALNYAQAQAARQGSDGSRAFIDKVIRHGFTR